MDLENTIVSEVSQIKTNIVSLNAESKKNNTNASMYKTASERKQLMVTKKENSGKDKLGVWD